MALPSISKSAESSHENVLDLVRSRRPRPRDGRLRRRRLGSSRSEDDGYGQDGSISATEHAAGAKKMFEKMDADGDGIVTAEEMDAAHKDMPSAHAEPPAQADASASTADAGKPMKSVGREDQDDRHGR